METVLAACVTGGLALLGVIITNYNSNKKMQAAAEKNQAVFETHRLEDLEQYHKPN